jgi:hypothetical protein
LKIWCDGGGGLGGIGLSEGEDKLKEETVNAGDSGIKEGDGY